MALVTQHSISVIFPAYNEEANIDKAVDQATQCLEYLFQDWEIIVVNDGSQDRTGEMITRLAAQDARVIAVQHPINRGYGAALQSGIRKAQKELIFFCDADLQFHLSEILLPLTWIEQYDLVIGYRVRRRDPFQRRLNAWCWNVLVRLLLGLQVHDIDCAFKLFRHVVFQAIQIDAVGAMVNTEILVQATRMGFRIREVPVTHFPRQYGTPTGAKMRVILKAFTELVRLYRKLQMIQPTVSNYDRRGTHKALPAQERRQKDRRQVLLPINFPDRRRRFLRVNNVEIPLHASMGSYPPLEEG
jgi:glycosyltransferase involved in cell wall biosynthesis